MSGTCRQNPNQSCHAVQDQASQEIKQIHVWFPHPQVIQEALEFDKENNNTKWADVTRDEVDCIKEQEVFTTCQRAKWHSNHK